MKRFWVVKADFPRVGASVSVDVSLPEGDDDAAIVRAKKKLSLEFGEAVEKAAFNWVAHEIYPPRCGGKYADE